MHLKFGLVYQQVSLLLFIGSLGNKNTGRWWSRLQRRVFANVFRLILMWPDGFTYCHWKRQVLIELIDECQEMSMRLQCNFNKSKLSYEEAITEIVIYNDLESIPDLLGNFIFLLLKAL